MNIKLNLISLKAWTADSSFQAINFTKNDVQLDLKQSEKYEVQFIPKRDRRRMSQLSKITVDLALEICQDYQIDHAVFATRYGELDNTFKLIKMLNEKEELSPTQFSQSVHNTSSGLYSIISKTKSPIEVISAGSESLSMGLVSAFSYGAMNPGKNILYIYSDEAVPDELVHLKGISQNKSLVLGLIFNSGSASGIHTSLEQKVKIDFISDASMPYKFLKEIFYTKSEQILLKGEDCDWQFSL